MSEINLFNEKFIRNGRNSNWIGKQVFIATKEHDFEVYVNTNNRAQLVICEGFCQDDRKYLIHGHQGYASSIYYDPNYEVKWAFFKEGKKAQWSTPIGNSWTDIKEELVIKTGPRYFDDGYRYRIKPQKDSNGVDMANKKDVKLFNQKFVHFMGEKEMIGRKGFGNDGIGGLKTDVENNRCPCECIDVDDSEWIDYPFKTKTDEDIYEYAFFYYDPHYEVKWAYFKEGKTVQVKADERWGKWLDAPENHDLKWFDSFGTGELRIKPKEEPALVDIKAENMEVTLNINGQDVKFKSVEEARLFLNTDK